MALRVGAGKILRIYFGSTLYWPDRADVGAETYGTFDDGTVSRPTWTLGLVQAHEHELAAFPSGTVSRPTWTLGLVQAHEHELAAFPSGTVSRPTWSVAAS